MKEAEKHNITEKDLALEIMAALKDFFVAQIENEGNKVFIKFLGEKNFVLTVQEEK